MAEETENLTLAWMRRLDEKFDRVIAVVGDLKLRVTGLEAETARLATQIALVNARLDGVDLRLDRIERRVGLIDAS